MRPLVLHDALAGVLYFTCLAGWTIGEITLAVRTTGAGSERDRSHFLLFAGSMAGFTAAIVVAASATSLTLPGGGWWPVIAGLLLFAAGVVYRAWAIRTLGRFFVFVVEIQDDHRVVREGPYALIRHPGYLGLLAAVAGLGLALDNWLAFVICFLPPLIGFTRRIAIEDRVLRKELGEPYREYAERTSRLIPGVW